MAHDPNLRHREILYNAAKSLPMTTLREIAEYALEAPFAEFDKSNEAAFAMDLVDWAWRQGAPAIRALERALRKAHPAAFEQALDPADEPTDPDVDRTPQFRAYQLEQARHVPIIGFHDKSKVRLHIDDVFVPLHFSRRSMRTLGAHMDAEGPRGLAPMMRSEITIEEALADVEQRRGERADLHGVAVVGMPGSGKTTLLKHVYRHAADQGSASLGLPADLTPVLLRADRVLETAQSQTDTPMADLRLGDVLEREARAARRGFDGAGRALATSGPLLLLVDALDEAGGPSGMQQVCAWLERQMYLGGGHRWVLTCRSAAWAKTRGRMRGALLPLDVGQLTLEAANRYVHGWFRAVALREAHETDAQFADRATALADAITDPTRLVSKRLRDMVGNPLMLSLVCLVHHTLGHLPKARAKLYDECLGVLLQAWAEHKAVSEGTKQPQIQVDVDAARMLLTPLAWQMQQRQVEDQPVDMTRGEVLEIFASRIERIPALAGHTAEQLLDLLAEHCGVLHSPDFDHYRFVHLSFQEYLAARHAEGRTDEGAKELADKVADPRWREPILLALSRGTLVRAFWRAALARPDAADHEDLLRECLDQGAMHEEEPFVELLTEAATAQRATPTMWQRLVGPKRPPPPATPTVRMVLDLLATRRSPAITKVAHTLCEHPDRGIATRARAVLRPRVQEGVDSPDARAPGQLRTIRCGTVPLELVWVPSGEFWMGATTERGQNHDPEAREFEGPVRRVRITRGFWMGRHPVTVAQYRAFCTATGSEEPDCFRQEGFNQDDHPVTTVAHAEAEAFADWAGQAAGDVGALPTEAQWEWAARGPEGFRYPWGQEAPDATRAHWVVTAGGPDKWWSDMSEEEQARVSEAVHPVGGRPAGASVFGAEDMAGHVWEWCRDAWEERHVEDVADPCRNSDNPEAPRVVRGGSWYVPSGYLRCSARGGLHPGDGYDSLGFRVVLRPDSSD